MKPFLSWVWLSVPLLAVGILFTRTGLFHRRAAPEMPQQSGGFQPSPQALAFLNRWDYPGASEDEREYNQEDCCRLSSTRAPWRQICQYYGGKVGFDVAHLNLPRAMDEVRDQGRAVEMEKDFTGLEGPCEIHVSLQPASVSFGRRLPVHQRFTLKYQAAAGQVVVEATHRENHPGSAILLNTAHH